MSVEHLLIVYDQLVVSSAPCVDQMLVPSKGPVLTIVPKSQDSVKVQVHVSKPWRSGGVVQTAHRRIRDHPATPDDVEPDVELHHHLSCHGSGHRHCGGKVTLHDLERSLTTNKKIEQFILSWYRSIFCNK